MVCIYCGSKTQVTNSRLQKRANQIWRRRQCISCGNNFTTHEVVDLGSTLVVRYSGKDLRAFSRDRLFTSIFDSCKHRASAVDDAAALCLTAISQLRQHATDGVLERDTVVAVTNAVLERFDKAASTMYAAYHPLTK